MTGEIAAALRVQTLAQADKDAVHFLYSSTAHPPPTGGDSKPAQPASIHPSCAAASGQSTLAASAPPPPVRRVDGEAGWDARCCIGAWDSDAAAALEASHWYIS